MLAPIQRVASRRDAQNERHGAGLRSSVALILRVASRRDALNEEPASFSLVVVLILISMLVVAHTPQSWATPQAP